MKAFLWSALCLVAACTAASDDISKPLKGVTELTTANFKRETGNGKYWFVEFYAPWCGWCKKLAPEIKKLGEAVGTHSKVAIGKFNGDEEDDTLMQKYKVKGFPTIIFLTPSGETVKFNGRRDVQGFLDFINKEAGVNIEIKIKPEERLEGGTGVVQVLTTETFDKLVQSSTTDVFVKFYAPWCGHCKTMAEPWKDLAAQWKGTKDVAIAELDADTHRDIGNKYGVNSFPTIKLFTKADKSGIEFSGPRTTESFAAFLRSNRA